MGWALPGDYGMSRAWKPDFTGEACSRDYGKQLDIHVLAPNFGQKYSKTLLTVRSLRNANNFKLHHTKLMLFERVRYNLEAEPNSHTLFALKYRNPNI